MPHYIVNKNAQFNSGDHEVHLTPRSSCTGPRYPLPENQVSLGSHPTCHGAVREANARDTRLRTAVLTARVSAIPDKLIATDD